MPITIKKKAASVKRQGEPELRGAVQKVTGYFSAGKKILMPIIITVIALAVIVLGYLLIQSGKNREASARVSAANGYYHPAPGSMPDYSKALDLYRDIQKNYSGTRSGATAQYYIGNSLVGLGRLDEALREYQYFVKKYSDEKLLLGFVYQRMGYVYAALGNQAEAMRSFERSEGLTGPGVVTMELARLYENAGRSEDSQKKYRTLIEKMPGSQWSMEAMAKLKQPASAPETPQADGGK